MKEASFCD